MILLIKCHLTPDCSRAGTVPATQRTSSDLAFFSAPDPTFYHEYIYYQGSGNETISDHTFSLVNVNHKIPLISSHDFYIINTALKISETTRSLKTLLQKLIRTVI